MLILFDIDATLVTTSGVGRHAMAEAGRRLYGPSFTPEGVEFAGRLDPLILADLLVRNGLEPTSDRRAAMRREYRAALVEGLGTPGIARALPGVHAVVDALSREAGVTIGLLTGNFEETGRLKLGACSLDADRFPVRVWGDESPHEPPSRDHLPAVAIARYQSVLAGPVRADRVTIVGDTVHDVACARANGCRSLAVATGSFSPDALQSAGADAVMADLSDAGAVLRWLLG
ncbi:MAG: haloacid dehalogenase [Phycisphaerales bacterium]|nr:HAD family hydrolase [Phycisphaerales bacterium]GIK19582.1 MAG: hydrolase [Planctomycetota bacterium]